jgi:protein phosphatase methylesterase 1
MNPYCVKGWFTDLTEHFLLASCHKLLLLADTNRLIDKKLIIGQMQGKFQLSVLSAAGHHAIQEDYPEEVARILVQFWQRFSNPQIPNPSSTR